MNLVHHLAESLSLFPFLLIGGFLDNLFGGTKTTNQTTQTTNNVDASSTTTVADSGNTSSWLQNNLSYMKYDSKVQNLNLPITDSFNKILTQNWANVGNNGGTGATPMLDGEGMQKFFSTVLANPAPGVNSNTVSVDPNANPGNFTFTKVNDADTLGKLLGGIDKFFNGVDKVTQSGGQAAAGLINANSSGSANPGAPSSGVNPLLIVAMVGAAIVLIFMLRRK